MRSPEASVRDHKRVLVIDKRKLRQAGIMHLVEAWAETLGLAVTAVPPDKVTERAPDEDCAIVILDVCSALLREPEQKALMEDLRRLMPEASLVIVSDREEAQEVCSAFQAGAAGFLPTSLDPTVALQALSFIHSGGTYFPPSALAQVCPPEERAHKSAMQTYKAMSKPAPLSSKQQAVVELLRQGCSNKEIARRLSMAESTVKVHVRTIMRKLGARNRTQVALSAYDDGHTSFCE